MHISLELIETLDNTKFFFFFNKMANAHGRNFLDKTTVNGVMLSKEATIKE